MSLERGVLGISLTNLLITGIIAIVAVIAYNKWVAQKTIVGVTLPNA